MSCVADIVDLVSPFLEMWSCSFSLMCPVASLQPSPGGGFGGLTAWLKDPASLSPACKPGLSASAVCNLHQCQ